MEKWLIAIFRKNAALASYDMQQSRKLWMPLTAWMARKCMEQRSSACWQPSRRGTPSLSQGSRGKVVVVAAHDLAEGEAAAVAEDAIHVLVVADAAANVGVMILVAPHLAVDEGMILATIRGP